MKLQGITIKSITADEGMLLTQAVEVPAEERIFSSKVYDDNLDNWTEWTITDAEEFIQKQTEMNESNDE